MLNTVRRCVAAIEFLVFYVREILLCNVRVAIDVLTPTHHMKPAFLELPVDGLTDQQLLALANLISMTPGTLTLDVDDARKALLIHCMYADDPERMIAQMQRDYVRRIRRVF